MSLKLTLEVNFESVFIQSEKKPKANSFVQLKGPRSVFKHRLMVLYFNSVRLEHITREVETNLVTSSRHNKVKILIRSINLMVAGA